MSNLERAKELNKSACENELKCIIEIQARRAALLEEVVSALETLQITQEHGAILRGAGKLGMEIESDKYTNLIARVRAEWGNG